MNVTGLWRRPGRQRLSGDAVVAGAGSVTALAAVRSLGRAGFRVTVVGPSPDAISFRSRFARRLLCPNPREDEAGYIDVLVGLGKTLEGPAPIFPTGDLQLAAIGRNQDVLSPFFRFPFPSWDRLEPLLTKSHQVQRAAELGIPTPHTATTATDDFGFPVLVKPSLQEGFVDAFGAKAIRCHSRGEVEDLLERARAFAPVVQEWIPGKDDALYFLGTYLDQEGRAVGAFTGRKLRQIPVDVGTTRIGVAVPMPEVERLGLSFLHGLGYAGLADVEFKLDPRDGQFKFMEVNARLAQWHGLAAASGVDLPVIAAHDLLGRRLEPQRQTPSHKRWAITFLTGSGHERPEYSGTGPAFTRLPYTDAIFARDDVGPAAAQLRQIGASFLRRARRRLAPSRD
jgi:D-aspartate ligase